MPDRFFVKPKKAREGDEAGQKRRPGQNGESSRKTGTNSQSASAQASASTSRKSKRSIDAQIPETSKKAQGTNKRRKADDEGLGDSDLGSDTGPFVRDEVLDSDEEDRRETPQQKRIRLAKAYLKELGTQAALRTAESEGDALQIEREHVERRLKRDVAETKGQTYRFIAERVPNPIDSKSIVLTSAKHFRYPPTAIAIGGPSNGLLCAAGKDGVVHVYSAVDGHRMQTFPKDPKGKKGHADAILCIACSSDGKYLVTGGKDKMVGVWDLEKMQWITGLTGFNKAVSSVCFRNKTLTLYAASLDRSIRVYDLHAMGFVEALFGHTEPIMSISALNNELAVSAGGADCTLRWWKILDSTQLVFRAGTKSKAVAVAEGEDIDEDAKVYLETSVDCVAMLSDTLFVSGGDTGSVCLWHISKKKPIYTRPLAHGSDTSTSATEGSSQHPRGITALAALGYSDLFASGSSDGNIKIWALDPAQRKFTFISSIPVLGFVNDLCIQDDMTLDVAQWTSRSETSRLSKGDRPATGSALRSSDHNNSHNGVNGTDNSTPKNRNIILAAAVGREPRLGRWRVLHGTETCGERILICHLLKQDSET